MFDINSLTLRSTMLLVFFVTLGVVLMASLSFISLNNYTSENSQIRIERAAQAAVSLFEANMPGDVVHKSDEQGLPSYILLQGDDPIDTRRSPKEFDALLKDISRITTGASNLFSWNSETRAFDRFATTFRRPDGSLPPAFSISSGHPAFETISTSQVYRGDVPVMGRMRYAYLTPILFDNSELAGVLAIDVGWSDDLKTGQDVLKRRIILFAVTIFGVTSIIGGALHWFMWKPLPLLASAAHRIATGERESKMLDVVRKDELGSLAKGLQQVDQLHAELDILAYSDPLTNLGNRSYFRRALSRKYKETTNFGPTSLFLIDIDRFRSVNDGFGSEVGDKVLIEVSKRLAKLSGSKSSIIARFGSNEFIISTDFLKSSEQDSFIIELRQHLMAPYCIDSFVIELTFTIGITSVDFQNTKAYDAERNVQLALKAAKEKGPDSFEIFDPVFLERSKRQHEIYVALRQALKERNSLTLHFQVQVSCQIPTVIGVEALIRWPQDDGSILMPAEIIPIAVSKGLMVELGNWVLDEACRNMRDWMDNKVPVAYFAVNVSPVQLLQPDFVDVVQDTLRRYEVPANKLCLEITEEVFVNFTEARIQSVFSELRALGVRMSLDDFGTGYSSLGYLRGNLFDQLKIDRDFVANLSTDTTRQHLFTCILQLAAKLQLEVVAEGIETEQDMSFVAKSGCSVVQGYYLAQPCPASKVSENIVSAKKAVSI